MSVKLATVFVLLCLPSMASGTGYDPENCRPTVSKANTVGNSNNTLFLGGLNFRSDKLAGFEPVFLESGYNIDYLFLKSTNLESDFYNSSELEKLWKQQLFQKLCHRRSYDNSKFVVVGYSLGALVVEDFLIEEPAWQKEISLLVFLAPALEIKSFYESLLDIGKRLPDWLLIPSFNLKNYRAKWYTRIAEYAALKNIYDRLHSRAKGAVSTPSFVILSKGDELINFEGSIERIKNTHLSYSFFEINKDPDAIGKQHLIVDENTVGKELWGSLKQNLKDLIP